jgi:hypothetical protein
LLRAGSKERQPPHAEVPVAFLDEVLRGQRQRAQGLVEVRPELALRDGQRASPYLRHQRPSQAMGAIAGQGGAPCR